MESSAVRNLNDVYSQMQTLEDSTRAAVKENLIEFNAPPVMIDKDQRDALSDLRESPNYKRLQNEAENHERSITNFKPYKAIILTCIGIVVCAVMSCFSLFVMTKVKFTDLLLRGDDQKFNTIEGMATIRFLSVVFAVAGAIYIGMGIILTL